MKILKGLSDGALLQRDYDGECMLYFEAEAKGELKSNIGTVKRCLSGYVLSGIKCGGPYDLVLSDGEEELKLTVWVGDLYVAAGQSNMEGSGIFTDEAKKEAAETPDYIREYYFEKVWDRATPVSHTREREAEVKRGVGPAYYFAREMYRLTKVPQGIIPCAKGGSRIDEWKADGGELYKDMIKRISEAGGRVRGLLWYQGESEAMTPGADKIYYKETERIISALRNDLASPFLPIVISQISQTALDCYLEDEEGHNRWQIVREEERVLSENTENAVMIATTDADFDDLIHLSTSFQRVMGRRNALAMAHLCGIEGGKEPPKLLSVALSDGEIRLTYSGTESLKACGVPSGFVLTKYDGFRFVSQRSEIIKTCLCGNSVILVTELKKEEMKGRFLYYMYGNSGYCNITTEEGFALPALGPIKL